MEKLGSLITLQFLNLVEVKSTHFAFTFKYKDILTLDAKAREHAVKKCERTDHTRCLPHLCVQAYIEIFKEVKDFIAFEAYFSDEKLVKFTTGEPHTYRNPLKESLEKLGYSTDYAKQLYVRNPHCDFYVTRDLSMWCIRRHLEFNTEVIWGVADKTLSKIEKQQLMDKHNDVIQIETLHQKIFFL